MCKLQSFLFVSYFCLFVFMLFLYVYRLIIVWFSSCFYMFVLVCFCFFLSVYLFLLIYILWQEKLNQQNIQLKKFKVNIMLQKWEQVDAEVDKVEKLKESHQNREKKMFTLNVKNVSLCNHQSNLCKFTMMLNIPNKTGLKH